jgi:hypothetical protein
MQPIFGHIAHNPVAYVHLLPPLRELRITNYKLRITIRLLHS